MTELKARHVMNRRVTAATPRAIGRDLFRMHDLEDSAANWQRLVAGYLRRLPEITPKDLQRMQRYVAGWQRLTGDTESRQT